jgi:UDP-N-acetyl-D-mannosaminuronic acid dehydrogenase
MQMTENNSSNIHCVLVIGLGRIGLPQALFFAHSGIKVYGYDQSSETTEALKQSQTPFYEPFMDEYLKETINKNFFPCSDWSELSQYLPEVDAIIFTIGTSAPTEEDVLNEKQIDFSDYFALLDKLFFNTTLLKQGIKLIVRTTLPLGGTDKLRKYVESKYFLQEGVDFNFAFVPERITEGAAIEELKIVPKIIGVYSEPAFESISKLFQNAGSKIIHVKNPMTAEFCKLTDNAFRSTLFSFANEIAMHASQYEIDIEEVIGTVNDQYARNHIPFPGFVSGYCLSKDPYIFELGFSKNEWKRDFQSVWFYGRRTNDYLVEFVVDKVFEHLENPVSSCVAILGLSFKENVDDFRISHSLSMIELLIKKNIKKFKVYDPYLDKNKYTTLPKDLLPYITEKTDNLDADFLADVDAVIICDRHTALCDLGKAELLNDLLQHTQKPCYVFDGWDIWRDAAKVDHINYQGIGFKKDYTRSPL